MRVLQINKFHTVQGGADKYYLDLTKELKMAGHQVANFAMQRPDNQHSEWSQYFVSQLDFSLSSNPLKNIKNTLRVIGRSFWSIEAAKKLERLIKDFQPDVAHLHTFYHQLSPSILPVLKKYNIPVIMTVHDYNLISCNYVRYHHNAICSHSINGNYWKAIIHKCVKDSYLASMVEALNHYLFKWLKIYEKHVDLFIFPSKFHAAEHGNSELKMKNTITINNYFEANGTIDNNEIGDYIFYVGRLSPEKGVDTLIKAYAKAETHLKLIICGDGPQLKELKSLAAELKTNVEFLGYLPNEQVLNYLVKSAFKVFPSRALENQPLVILESMALGKPVIASNVGGISELIENEKNGLLFESGNEDELAIKIKELSDDSNKLLRLGLKAKQTIEQEFNKNLHFNKLINIYNQMLQN